MIDQLQLAVFVFLGIYKTHPQIRYLCDTLEDAVSVGQALAKTTLGSSPVSGTGKQRKLILFISRQSLLLIDMTFDSVVKYTEEDPETCRSRFIQI